MVKSIHRLERNLSNDYRCLKFLLAKNDSSAIFRSGDCIGFAETLPVTTRTEINPELQQQLDNLHLRISKQETRKDDNSIETTPKYVEPQITWADLDARKDADRNEAIRNERIRNLKNSKLFPQRCL